MEIRDKVPVVVSVTGSETGRVYEGTFEVKTKRSVSERFQEDELRRRYLGGTPGVPDADTADLASLLAFLNTRVVDGPQWWKDSQGGLGLADENVVGELATKCAEEIRKEKAKLAKKAGEAQAELAAAAKT